MRIISGKFRNKKLYFPKNLKTRPLKDSVRENIFNILEHSNNIEIKIKNASIVDLYAGIGSFGLECLSREASQTFFVEKDEDALINLKKNVKNLNLEDQAKIYSMNVLKFVKDIKLKKTVMINPKCILSPSNNKGILADSLNALVFGKLYPSGSLQGPTTK